MTSSEVGGTKDGSTNWEGLSDDQHETLLIKSKNCKDTVSASTCNTAKKGRNTSLCTTKDATSKQQSAQKQGEQTGGSRLTEKVDGISGTKSGNASLCTTKSVTSKQRNTQKREQARESRLMKTDGSTSGTKSGSLRVTRSQTQNSRNVKLCDSTSSASKPRKKL